MSNWQYRGCFKDAESRTIPIRHPGNISYEACKDKAEETGARYFGLQYWEGDKNRNTGACFTSYGPGYNKYGSATNCTTDSRGKKIGSSWSNAVYENVGAKPITTPDGNYIYLGCHRDTDKPSRAVPMRHGGRNVSFNQCAQAAKSAGATTFALQWWQGDGNKATATCWYGTNPDYRKYGAGPDSCIKWDDKFLGGSWTNAVYMPMDEYCKNPSRYPFMYLNGTAAGQRICNDRRSPIVQAKCCFGQIKDPARCRPTACNQDNIKAYCRTNQKDPKCSCEYPSDLPANAKDIPGINVACHSHDCVTKALQYYDNNSWVKQARRPSCPTVVNCTQILQTQAGRDAILDNVTLNQSCGDQLKNPDPNQDPTRVPIKQIPTTESIFDNKVMWTIIAVTVIICITLVVLLLGGGGLLLIL